MKTKLKRTYRAIRARLFIVWVEWDEPTDLHSYLVRDRILREAGR